MGYPNGLNPQAGTDAMSPDIIAAVRQQMCNMVDAANFVAGFNLPPNMTIQSMNPQNLGGSSSSNIPNPKIGSPVMNSLSKNGAEHSNILQMPQIGSPSLHSLPNELSLMQSLSPNEEDFRKKERIRLRKASGEDFSHPEDQQKVLNNNRLSITKLNSPKTPTKSPSLEAFEPAVNLAISGQSLDMSFKSSRMSSDDSINGEDLSSHSYRSPGLMFKDSSPIKLEPLTDCRD